MKIREYFKACRPSEAVFNHRSGSGSSKPSYMISAAAGHQPLREYPMVILLLSAEQTRKGVMDLVQGAGQNLLQIALLDS